MKTRTVPTLLASAIVAAASFSSIAFAQSEDTTNAYKKTWSGVASLQTLQLKQKTRNLLAVYPVFGRQRPVAKVAGSVLKKEAIDSYNGFEKDSRGTAEKLGLHDDMKYEFEIKPSLEYNRPRLISATTMFYQYEGGAHGIYGTSGYVFGYPAKSGAPRQLHLADFFTTDIATTRKGINSLLMAKLRATKGKEQEAMWVFDGTVKSVTNDQMENFIAEKDGLRWYFGPYAVGPYANGEYEVKITTRELGPTFRASMLR